MKQDSPDDRRVCDRRDHVTRCTAPRTDQDSGSEHAFEQLGPSVVPTARDGLVRVGTSGAGRTLTTRRWQRHDVIANGRGRCQVPAASPARRA